MTQLVRETTKEGGLRDLLLLNKEELAGEVMVGGYLGHSDHETIEFSILGKTGGGLSKIATLESWRASFGLLRRLTKCFVRPP